MNFLGGGRGAFDCWAEEDWIEEERAGKEDTGSTETDHGSWQ